MFVAFGLRRLQNELSPACSSVCVCVCVGHVTVTLSNPYLHPPLTEPVAEVPVLFEVARECQGHKM